MGKNAKLVWKTPTGKKCQPGRKHLLKELQTGMQSWGGKFTYPNCHRYTLSSSYHSHPQITPLAKHLKANPLQKVCHLQIEVGPIISSTTHTLTHPIALLLILTINDDAHLNSYSASSGV